MTVQIWQLIVPPIVAFLFGLGLGRGLGTVACWRAGHLNTRQQEECKEQEQGDEIC